LTLTPPPPASPSRSRAWLHGWPSLIQLNTHPFGSLIFVDVFSFHSNLFHGEMTLYEGCYYAEWQ
jgi:hypothetical protein